MRVQFTGGPLDGAEAIIPQHIEAGTEVKVEGAGTYTVERRFAAGPRLVFQAPHMALKGA